MSFLNNKNRERKVTKMTNLKTARKAANLTQPELAELVGCGKATIQRWEYRTTAPKLAPHRLSQLAAALNLSIEETMSLWAESDN